jgi:signal transduction histidine kinase/ligand-binding sensor domain-containing protein
MANQTTINCKTVFLQFLFTWFLLVQLYAQSQNAAFRNLTSAQGLPVTSVTDIDQDAFGFIWIASWSGAYRYDGRSFKKISTSDGRSLNADKKGGMWITFDSSVAYFDPYADSIREYPIPNADRYGDLRVDNAGEVWVATLDGLLRFDQQKNLFVRDDRQRSGQTNRLVASPAGELVFHFIDKNSQQRLIGKRNLKGNYEYEPYPKDLNSEKKDDYFRSSIQFFILPMDSTGMVLINNWGWAYKSFDNGNWTFKKLAKNEKIPLSSDIKVDAVGNMWLNNIDTLTKINILSGNKIVYVHDPANPQSILPFRSGQVCEMFFDKQGILWIPRFTYGISRLNLFENDFGLLLDETGSPIIDVLSTHESSDGSFWIGSRIPNNGLIYFSADRKIIKRYGTKSFESPPGKTISNELSHPFPWALAQTSDGSIWVGGGSPGPQMGGVSRIRPGTNLITRFKNDPNDTSSISGDWNPFIKVDGSDRVWLFTRAGMCFIDPATEKVTRWKKDQSFDSADSALYYPELVTSSGDLVVGIYDDKVKYIIRHSTLKAQSFGPTSDSSEELEYMHEDDKGRIWFITKKGFGYLDTTFTSTAYYYKFDKKGTEAYEISALNSDKEGKIWLSTTNGILQFDPATEMLKHFGFERGLQGINFYDLVNYKGPSGKIYFGGNGGINIFDPASIKANPYPPAMVFTGLKLDGRSVTPGKNAAIEKQIFLADEINVSPDVLTISIDFAAIHFAGENSNQYQYKLEGFDKSWRDGGTTGNATYTNLPPGKYTLYIRGSNWDNVWSDGKKSIDIIILPPWWRTNAAYAFYILAFIALLFGINRIQRKRVIAKERERTRDKELAQAREIEKAYNELRTTQAQLIQSEKMASLGELTAGIAHEIQNPLNFVNNFSEVNKELIEELKIKNEKLKIEDGEVKDLINDIEQNLEKINHHGKKADAIVKGMLQHSRTSSGQKEPTDINALADEYLRLAYHGLRAKDKSFNAMMKTDFDESIGNINIVPQDIGRVILNLINNAFYAAPLPPEGGFKDPHYIHEPTVWVSTKKTSDKILISVKDNGPGIPQKIVDKIFQPFFTTKPTGQGTGLGLSLSYDIVKAHGGELKVETIEGAGTVFTIVLS